jgi:PAS domain S-box-containing protein
MADIDKVEDKGTFLLELYRKALNLHQNELYEYFLDNAVKVTKSKIGFFHFVNEDQKTIVLTMWNKEALKNCTANFSVHYSIGEAGNWADCIREKQAKIYNDFNQSPNQKGLPKGHVPISRMLTVPIMEDGNVYAIFGVGNKELPYSDGDIVQLEVVSNELYKIMRQRLAEAEVRGEREKYRSLFENMLDGFAFCKMILNKEGKPVDFEYLEINNAFERLTGLKREAVVGKRVTQAIPGIEKANPELFEIYGRVASTCVQERFDVYFKPLSKWFSISVYCPQKGYFAAIFEDITHRKKAEAALRESEQRWSTTLSSIGDAVIATDVFGNVTFMNKVAEDLTGWAVNDAQQRSLKEIFTIINEKTRREVESPVNMVLKEGMVVGLANHTILVQKGGKEVPIDDSGTPIKDDEGNIEGVVLVFRDITERKKSEEELTKQAAFIALSPDAIIGKKFDDTITFWSQGAQNLYGWTKEEALGKKSRSLLRTKFPEPYEVIVKALLSWGSWSGEKTHHDKFGREIIVESRWLALYNGQIGRAHV